MCNVQHGSAGNDEQPTSLAEWIIVMEPLLPDDPASIEQPTWRAEWKIVTEPLPPWDVA
jgi:hypothetical protein